MTADPPLPSPSRLPASRREFALWLGLGAAGVWLLFLASVQVPQELKPAGLYTVALGGAAGWGLGRWTSVRNIRPSAGAIALIGLVVAAGEVLASVRAYQIVIAAERRQAKSKTMPIDPVTENLRRFLAEEPADETADARQFRQEKQAELQRNDERHRAEAAAQQKHRTFYGYLVNRIPRQWGRWPDPWPAIFWSAEILAGSILGAWLARRTIGGAWPAPSDSASTGDHDQPASPKRT